MSTTKTRSIDFANGKTKPEVVAEFLPAFKEAFDRLKPPTRDFVYNDDFLGEIEGLAGTEDESRAIYWLQNARRMEVHFKRVDEALNDGWVDYEDLSEADRAKRPESVLLVGQGENSNFVGGSTEWIEIPSGRIVLHPKTGEPHGILPKGKRTYGKEVGMRRLLVKVAGGKKP